jgi:hypothetical protein
VLAKGHCGNSITKAALMHRAIEELNYQKWHLLSMKWKENETNQTNQV